MLFLPILSFFNSILSYSVGLRDGPDNNIASVLCKTTEGTHYSVLPGDQNLELAEETEALNPE